MSSKPVQTVHQLHHDFQELAEYVTTGKEAKSTATPQSRCPAPVGEREIRATVAGKHVGSDWHHPRPHYLAVG